MAEVVKIKAVAPERLGWVYMGRDVYRHLNGDIYRFAPGQHHVFQMIDRER